MEVNLMNGKVKMKRLIIALVLVVGVCIPAYSQYWAGGFYSSADTGNCYPPASAFCSNIGGASCISTVQGPMVGYAEDWDTQNNSNWDYYEISFVCCHGGPWTIYLSDGSKYFNGSTCFSSSNRGWGDNYNNFSIFYSCQVIRSPLETGSWNDPWIDAPYPAFTGCHIVNGFRTNAWVSPAVNVTTYYCQLINGGGQILQSWFDAVYAHGNFSGGNDRATSVYYSACATDTLCSPSADPTSGSFITRYIN
jgi:hypothetical protein